MKPGFLQGFDEADRGKDVRRISVQESSALISVRPAAPPNKGNHATQRAVDLPVRSRRVPEVLARRTEGALRRGSHERDERLRRAAPRACDVDPRRRPGKQRHANEVYRTSRGPTVPN